MGQERMALALATISVIPPRRAWQDAVAHFVGLSKPYVIQIVMQPLDLLGQGHLEQADFDLRFFLATAAPATQEGATG